MQAVIGIAALVTAVGVIWRSVIKPVRRFDQRASFMLPLLIDLTETFHDAPGSFEVLKDIQAQFRTDSGSTLKDQIDRLEAQGDRLEATLAIAEAAAQTMKDQIRLVPKRDEGQ